MEGPEPGNRKYDTPMTDPNNGFERIFHSVRKNIAYSLVVVPAGVEFRIDYTKPSCDIDLILTEETETKWAVTGLIDTDTFSNLGFWVFRRRFNNNPPVVTAGDLNVARQMGTFIEKGDSKIGLPLYEVSLILPSVKVANFLERVWGPGRNPQYFPTQIPPIRVGDSQYSDKLLPQKGPVGNHVDSGAVLQVFNSSSRS